MVDTFIRIRNGIITEHYITEINDNSVFYGYKLAGHENKKATAVMTVDYFNKLVNNKLSGNYIIGKMI